MFQITIAAPKTRPREIRCLSRSCTLGRGEDDMVSLQGWTIGKQHASLERREEGVYVVRGEAGRAPIKVNGKTVSAEHGPLALEDTIEIGAYTITVEANSGSDAGLPQAGLRQAKANGARQEEPGSPSLVEKAPATDAFVALRKRVHEALLRELDLRRSNIQAMEESELRATVEPILADVLKRIRKDIPAGTDQERLVKEVLDEAIGLGPLEDLLADESVTEIMVNRYDEIFIERAGRLTESDVVFTSDSAVASAIERIASPLGRRIDESSPLLDARLADGSRVNAVIPPIALRGPSLTIRKFAKRKLTPNDLLGFDSSNEAMLEFLRIAVEQRNNVIVSGGTGSGKTTLLNILSNFIPDNERIVSIEDAAELKLYQPNLVSLEARPPNTEGKGEIVIRDLVRNALRMRPDRVVVGECRGGEALDMLQAMNTGHDGSLTTVHANSARDALTRLEVMVLMSNMDLPVSAIREQIASAVNVIIQQRRFACGSRKLTSVCEVTGMESGRIQLQEIFAYRQRDYNGPDGRVRGAFETTGAIPEFFEVLAQQGYPVDLELFTPSREAA
jgi:pilus assembly protein CpaF